MQPLDREQLARNRADMFLVGRVDLMAPLPRPLVEILPTGEGAPGQKVSFDEVEGPFYAPRAVGIADCVRHELETEALAKAAISGTGTISRPLPRSTTTCVLSIMTRLVAPPIYRSASVRNTLQSKRWNVG